MWTTASGRTCDGEQDDFITVLPMFHCVLITEGKKMSWSDCLPVLLGNGVNCVFCCLTTVTQSRSVFVWSWFIQQYFISAVVTSKLNLDSPSFSISLISFFFSSSCPVYTWEWLSVAPRWETGFRHDWLGLLPIFLSVFYTKGNVIDNMSFH